MEPEPAPVGASTVRDLLKRANEEVGFGSASEDLPSLDLLEVPVADFLADPVHGPVLERPLPGLGGTEQLTLLPGPEVIRLAPRLPQDHLTWRSPLPDAGDQWCSP